MIVTAIRRQVKRAGRVSIFVDGKYSFGLSDDALLQSKLFVGQELSASELRTLKQAADDDKMLGAALRYVTIRLRSEWEVQTYLARKHCSAPTTENILNKLRSAGLLNDEAFAVAWVASRRQLKPVSRRTILHELQAKHVSRTIIEQVLARDSMATDERGVLRELLAKKAARYPDKTKLMNYLARHGFQYDDIKQALAEFEQT